MKVPSIVGVLLSAAVALRTAHCLEINETAECIAFPDPHFTTFDGIKYDFQHHGCDVDLIDSANVTIQLRLTQYATNGRSFSEIDSLAIHFDNLSETLEIDRNGKYYLNNNKNNPNPPLVSIGGHKFTVTPALSTNDYKKFNIDLSDGHYIEVIDLPVVAEGGGLGIFVRGHGSMFHEAKGMCGKWDAAVPGLYDRGGFDLLPFLPLVSNWSTIIDASVFGDIWQVAGDNYFSNPNLNQCIQSRRLHEVDRKLQQTPYCEHCLYLNNLPRRENCEYDAAILGCNWVQNVPFYNVEDDTIWLPNNNNEGDCCFRAEPVKEGYKYVEAQPNYPFSFAKKPCEHNKECFEKTKCSSDDKCWAYKTCGIDDKEDCYRERKCSNKCVRRVNVEKGYKLVNAEYGYQYDKCKYNKDCFERKSCEPNANEKCFKYQSCEGSQDKKCYKDVECLCEDQDASPTQNPTASPTQNPTASPTQNPTASPTQNPTASPIQNPTGNSGKCDGCNWMHKWDKQEETGENFCEFSLKKPKLFPNDGKCDIDSDDQCIEGVACLFKYSIKYKLNNNDCVKENLCSYTIANARTSSTSPVVKVPIKKVKAVITEKDMKVACDCNSLSKVITIECKKGDLFFSLSQRLDYACSECKDIVWGGSKV